MIRVEDDFVSAPPKPEETVGDELDKVMSDLLEERPAVPEQDLPGWLKGLESPSITDETQDAGNDIPELQRPPMAYQEPEIAPELDVPAWMDENVPVSSQAVPTLPGEWIPSEMTPEADEETQNPLDQKLQGKAG